MKIYRARYRNTLPQYHDSKGIERSFMDRVNALRWLSSFGGGKYSEFYLDGERIENPREELKKSR